MERDEAIEVINARIAAGEFVCDECEAPVKKIDGFEGTYAYNETSKVLRVTLQCPNAHRFGGAYNLGIEFPLVLIQHSVDRQESRDWMARSWRPPVPSPSRFFAALMQEAKIQVITREDELMGLAMIARIDHVYEELQEYVRRDEDIRRGLKLLGETPDPATLREMIAPLLLMHDAHGHCAAIERLLKQYATILESP